MPKAGRLAGIVVALLTLAACAPTPPTRTGLPAASIARAESRPVPTATRAWTGDSAVAALRARLRSRDYPAAVAAGPMLADWDALAPASELAFEPAIPHAVRRGDQGAWLVSTEAGSWWVWEVTDRGPLPDPPVLR